jgi:5-hydroxyisourate hydrolase-like protein (transthyretin family)
MKHKITGSVLLLIFVAVAGLYGGATTCVSSKKFKVKKACRTVTDPTGAPIPKVDVELLDNQSVVLQRALTDEEGRFNVPNVAKGEYVLRVKSPYFVTAWQPFIVTKSSANARCSNPMEVRLELAGRCSSVAKPR